MTTLDSSSHRTPPIPVPVASGPGLAVALMIIFAGNYHISQGEHGGTGPALITAIGCLILSGILFGIVLPRFATPTTATILGVIAAMSLAAFWSGATPVLAAASLAATSGRNRTRLAGTAQALAGIATAAAVVITVATSHLL